VSEITNATMGTWNTLTGWSADVPVSAATTSPATNVTVNGSSASLFADNTGKCQFWQVSPIKAGVNGKNVSVSVCCDATSPFPFFLRVYRAHERRLQRP
jgi:hypothetical protein